MDIRRYFGAVATNKKSSQPTSNNKSNQPTTKPKTRSEDKKKQQINQANKQSADDVLRAKKKFNFNPVVVIEPCKKTQDVIVEDDDDEESPLPPPKRSSSRKRIRQILDESDDEDVIKTKKQLVDVPKKSKKSEVSKDLSTVFLSEYFEKKDVVDYIEKHKTTKQSQKQQQTKVVPGVSKDTETKDNYAIHDDDDFVETLRVFDSKDQKKANCVTEKEVVFSTPKKAISKTGVQSAGGGGDLCPNKVDFLDSTFTPKSAEKKNNLDNYLKYLHREGPSAPGSKQIPEGKPNCFAGLRFIVTGVLESLERDEVNDLVAKYGGQIQKSVCRNTSYVVLGKDAGPAKIEKATKFKTKIISEDEFLDLIRASLGSQKNNATQIKAVEPEPVVSVKPSKKAVPEPVESDPEPVVSVKPSKKAVPKPVESDPVVVDAASSDNQMWVDKYRPLSVARIIGQQGDRSNVRKLKLWLERWHQQNGGTKKSRPFAGRWGTDDGSGMKAGLLSGPPGVGKTTSAQLVCQELGFSYVELNASNTRSKRSLQEEVAHLLGNTTLMPFALGNCDNDAKKHCLLMDEVDGMSGNEDRGGVQELIQLIKNTKIPIICMCNDRNHPKIRSLANYCFDLRFQKPRVEHIKASLMSICFKEGLTIVGDALQEIIVGANQDIRQSLHHLQLWSIDKKKITVEEANKDATKSKKDLKMGPFDVVRSVFSASEHKHMSIHDKSDLFFYDYSISPLFVFENYLAVVPAAASHDSKERLRLLSKAADSICQGDIIDKIIRSESQWSLLPVQAMFASVIPGNVLEGHIGQMIAFPSWLGRNSTRNKMDRLLQELHVHTRLSTSGSKMDFNLDYAQHLVDGIVRPLTSKQVDGVTEAVQVMTAYNLLREDLEALLDVTTWDRDGAGSFAALSPQVKAAFTRSFNKVSHLNPYSVTSVSAKAARRGHAAADAMDESELLDETVVEENEADDEDVTKDAMIKVAKKQKTTKEPSTSKRTMTKSSGSKTAKKAKLR